MVANIQNYYSQVTILNGDALISKGKNPRNAFLARNIELGEGESGEIKFDRKTSIAVYLYNRSEYFKKSNRQAEYGSPVQHIDVTESQKSEFWISIIALIALVMTIPSGIESLIELYK